MTSKSIKINQRIPLEILHVALKTYLDGNYSDDYIKQQLRLEFSGENRISKALWIVNNIVPKNPLINILKSRETEVNVALKSVNDRNIILISLLNASFPFAFDLLQVLGKYFSVQDTVNSDIIVKKVSAVYGGNRSSKNAIYSVIPMFIEAKLMNRPKLGIYRSTGNISIAHKITSDIYRESFRVNQKNGFHEGDLFDPYFYFLE